MEELVYVTGNLNKLNESEKILEMKLKHADIDAPEIQAINVSEVVKEKAIYSYNILKKPVVVDDSGLYFNSMKGFPGALIKWLFKSVGNEGIFNIINSFKNKSAYAEVVIGYYDGINFESFSGKIDGEIVKPAGTNGFGWDAIFKVNENSKTFAQMTSEEKNLISMRKIALMKFKDFLNKKNINQ